MSGEEGDMLKRRAENIKRNAEIMRALGLDNDDFRLHAAHRNRENGAKTGGKKKQGSESRKRKESDGSGADIDRGAPGVVTSRRSARVQGLAAGLADGLVEDPTERGERIERLSAEVLPETSRPAYLRAHRSLCGGPGRPDEHGGCEQHAAEERDHLRWAGRQKRTSLVGTASYHHTLYRVMSMSEKALANRIKTIERACGQHAVVKMRLFARVLCLEGYDELSADATDAYRRLVEKLGEPEEDSESGGEDKGSGDGDECSGGGAA